MGHFDGLDVSVKEISVCIVDDTGRIVREVKLASEPKHTVIYRQSARSAFRIGRELWKDMSCYLRESAYWRPRLLLQHPPNSRPIRSESNWLELGTLSRPLPCGRTASDWTPLAQTPAVVICSMRLGVSHT